MESFPAADENQFEFIKSLIDKCDYYVLIIGGRYGTVAEDGQSYTHKEFRYAVSKGVPVLVMLHGDRGKIPVDRSEGTDEGRRRLADFITEAETGRLRTEWTTLDGLKLAVREALDHAKATKPRAGWVRGDSVANLETLEELNVVRKDNERLREALGNLAIEVPLPSIPAAIDPVEIGLLPVSVGTRSGSPAKLKGTWITVFPVFFGNLKWDSNNNWNGEEYHYIDDDASCVAIGSALAGEVATVDTSGLFKISKGTLDRLTSYYIEVGLMTTDGGNPFTEAAQRVARRHRISTDVSSGFVLLAGEVTVSTVSFSRELDEEIPF